MYQVTKRDGSVANFEIGKISAAITKAFDAENKQYHPTVIDLLALRVTADFESKIRDGFIAVEDIQDSVEKVLSEAGYADASTPPCSTTRTSSTTTSRSTTGASRRTPPSPIPWAA